VGFQEEGMSSRRKILPLDNAARKAAAATILHTQPSLVPSLIQQGGWLAELLRIHRDFANRIKPAGNQR
jgi:hypothetical protein